MRIMISNNSTVVKTFEKPVRAEDWKESNQMAATRQLPKQKVPGGGEELLLVLHWLFLTMMTGTEALNSVAMK